jgi:hypothetical protein
MALPVLQLEDPLIEAMVTLLKANLNGVIAELTASYTDAYNPEQVNPAQIFPFIPTASELQGGLPLIGVGGAGTEFEDDTQFSMNATHEYVVVAICQNADHRTLTLQLRRMIEAIAYTIQQDRLLGTTTGSGGIMRDQGGALSVNFIRTQPGPVLGDVDPGRPAVTPSTYVSWTGLLLSSTRVEI